MIYKSFRWNTLIRIALLILTIFLFFFLSFSADLVALSILLSLLIIFQIASLIRYVDKTNRSLIRFFQSIRYDDFSQSFPSENGGSLQELHIALGEVMEHFKKTRAEKEEHFHYLQTVVQHVGVGLIAYNKKGEIDLINTAAKRLINLSNPKTISHLKSFSNDLTSTMKTIRSGEHTLVKIHQRDELLQLIVHATEFKKSG
jgi:signal transduction histidine kinase